MYTLSTCSYGSFVKLHSLAIILVTIQFRCSVFYLIFPESTEVCQRPGGKVKTSMVGGFTNTDIWEVRDLHIETLSDLSCLLPSSHIKIWVEDEITLILLSCIYSSVGKVRLLEAAQSTTVHLQRNKKDLYCHAQRWPSNQVQL